MSIRLKKNQKIYHTLILNRHAYQPGKLTEKTRSTGVHISLGKSRNKLDLWSMRTVYIYNIVCIYFASKTMLSLEMMKVNTMIVVAMPVVDTKQHYKQHKIIW